MEHSPSRNTGLQREICVQKTAEKFESGNGCIILYLCNMCAGACGQVL